MIVYVGTYTGPGKAEGIYVYRMDESTGALAHLQTASGDGADNPSFLALHPNGRTLYAANETPEGEGGVSAFAVDGGNRTLRFLNRQPSHGTLPCYVSLDHSGRFALVANYGNGIACVYPLDGEGKLKEASHVVPHVGSSSHRRQAGPHAHSIRMDPEGRYVFCADLGCDRVFVDRLDTTGGRLVPHTLPYAQLSSGAGPRHSAFHPNGRFVYVNNEIDSTVSAFAYDAERGALQIVDTRSTLPEATYGPAIGNSTAQVVAHPNGRFLYVSNRGHNSIAIFGIDPQHGTLRPLGHESTQGKVPRNFNIDPSGRFLYAANQNSGSVVSFAVDAQSGQLTPTGQVTDVPAPVCVIFGRE